MRLALWASGDDVPVFARGKLNLNSYNLNLLIETQDALVTLREHNTEKFGDAIPIFAKLVTASRTLEVRLGKEKGKKCSSVEDITDKIVYEGFSLGFLASAVMLMKNTTENFEESQGLTVLGGDENAKKESAKLDLAALAAEF